MLSRGLPYIRSIETLKPSSLALETTLLTFSELCCRSRTFRTSSSKLCTPTEIRFTPACLIPFRNSSLADSGLASRVISQSASSPKFCDSASRIELICSVANRDGVPPPKKIELIFLGIIPDSLRTFVLNSISFSRGK